MTLLQSFVAIISSIALLLSLYYSKKSQCFAQLSYFRISTLVLSIGILFLCLWLQLNFGQISIDKIISISYLGISGIDSWAPTWISLCTYLILYTSLGSLALLYLDTKLLQSPMNRYPWIYQGYQVYPAFILGLGLMALCYQSQFLDYLTYRYYRLFPNKQDYFQQYYHVPQQLTLNTKQPKNLILIYVESLESSYQNSKIFKPNLLSSLNTQNQAIAFKKFRQMPGADWSLAGIIASQCGIPLQLMGHTLLDRNLFGRHLQQILPKARCLTDILAQQHYHNVFMNGVSLKFAGIDHFLTPHHYHEVYGLEELRMGVPKNELSNWGIPDDILFEKAKQKLVQLMQQHRPFNLTLFTIDTHGVQGHINTSCKSQGAKDFEDIIHCSTNLVANFIHYIQDQGWSNQILIVVTGDHLAMRNQVSHKLSQIKSRYIFNMILNSGLQKNREQIYHVDLFPTILTGLGFQYPGNHLALGYSALGPRTPIPQHRDQILKKIYLSPSPLYDQLWS